MAKVTDHHPGPKDSNLFLPTGAPGTTTGLSLTNPFQSPPPAIFTLNQVHLSPVPPSPGAPMAFISPLELGFLVCRQLLSAEPAGLWSDQDPTQIAGQFSPKVHPKNGFAWPQKQRDTDLFVTTSHLGHPPATFVRSVHLPLFSFETWGSMATEFRRTKTLLLCGLALIALYDVGRCDSKNIFGLRNNNITLSPLEKTAFKDITWKKGKDKVAEWSEHGDFAFFGSFQGRATLDQFGNFTIQNLTASDEGQYEIESSDLSESEKTFLYVIEKLPQPHLNCSFDGENITVSCHGPADSRFLKYKWRLPEPYINLTESKVQLKISEDLSSNIYCTTWNPKSTNESSLFLRTCVPERGHSRHRYSIIGAFVLPIVLGLWFSGIVGRTS
ncbi:lymphocyte function-associated antigen 3 [Dromiciops gliroides]|uniref:lymphocyte function-associated antigen 3 n=1 Tax=Dromiciops gliroides TaxID=33562 RepID=UPI001CC8277E|nr:lymphocyte function-associated antigen 3 [Dromiciops gliroides]